MSRLGLMAAGESKTSLALAPLWGFSAVLTFQRVLVGMCGLDWSEVLQLQLPSWWCGVVLLDCPVLN